jgi:hypothetical protein
MLGSVQALEGVDISWTASDDEDLWALLLRKGIVAIEAKGCPGIGAGASAALPGSTSARYLELSHTMATDGVVESLGVPGAMECLLLRDTRVTDRCASTLARWPRLTSLDLGHCPGITPRVLEILERSPSLRWIGIEGAGVDADAARRFRDRTGRSLHV